MVLYTTDINNSILSENILEPTGNMITSKRFDGGFADEYFFYTHDVRGSTTSILQLDGIRVQNYSYDAFGNIEKDESSTFLNEVQFTGAIEDTSTGLTYMNARFYDSEVGRFLTQDTYTGNAFDSTTQHLYVYTGNNPVNYTDPTGHFIGTLTGALTGALIGGISAAIKGEDVWAGAISGGVSGAIAGAIIDLTVATGGTALVALAAAGAIGGAMGSATGSVIKQGVTQYNDGVKIDDIEIDKSEVMIDTAIGFIGGAIGGCVAGGASSLAKSLHFKEVSSTMFKALENSGEGISKSVIDTAFNTAVMVDGIGLVTETTIKVVLPVAYSVTEEIIKDPIKKAVSNNSFEPKMCRSMSRRKSKYFMF